MPLDHATGSIAITGRLLEMNARQFLAMVGKFSQEMFSVVKVQEDAAKPSLSLVSTKIAQSEGEPISAVWRVRNNDGQYKILDIVIEGVKHGDYPAP